jgi:predicted ATPase
MWKYSTASDLSDELAVLGEQKVAAFWKPFGIMLRGCGSALIGDPTGAVRIIPPGINAYRSTGAGNLLTLFLSHLAWAYFKAGQFADAQRAINEALTTLETNIDRWFEPEANRVAGEIALSSAERGATKAQAYFESALAVARQQQAKSWELRAAMSLARLWRDQGRVQQACKLLAPVYRWFTEGLDTRDLKEAKALLEELAT